MVIKWFNSLVHRAPASRIDVPQTGPLRAVDTKKGALVDIVYETLQKDMAFRQEVLRDLERVGWSLLKRRRFKQKVRSKIKQVMLPELSDAEGESLLEDEITERIVDVAENDPFYRRLFQSHDEG